MGLFDIFTKPNRKLLDWQNLVVDGAPKDRVVCSVQQLRKISEQQAKNHMRIINDCERIMLSTKKDDTFYHRLDLFEKSIIELKRLEPYVSFKGATPTQLLDAFYRDKEKLISDYEERKRNRQPEDGKRKKLRK